MVTYSTYEAKARLSELLRVVRSGKAVVITHHGRPVAEVRSIAKAPGDLGERLNALARAGLLATASRPARRPLEPLALRPGALRRFIAERDEP